MGIPNEKQMNVIIKSSLRELVEEVNRLEIKKEDIVYICKDSNQATLIYFS